MVESVNYISNLWSDYILNFSIQNSIYLVIIFGILYLLRKTSAKLLRIIVLFGLIKLLIPPFISSSPINDLDIPLLGYLTLYTSADTTPATGANVNLTVQSYLMILWFSITVFIVIATLINTFRFRLKFLNLKIIDVSDHINDGISNNISFYKSEHKHSPMLFGFIKIKIILPVDWDDWSTLQQRTVIVHELAHIKQKDHWINILKLIVCALYYFNPLVWLIIRRVNEYNELVCDDVTIETIESSGIEYSKQLLHFSEAYSNLNRVLPATVAFTESYRSIRKRFAYHLSKQEGFVMKNFKSKSIIVIVMCSLITIPFLWQCNNGESEQSVTTPIDNSEKIYDMNEVTEKPEMLHKEYPVYPEEARKAGVGGMTVVTVTIDELGNVEEAKIFRSSNPLFDEVSLTAAKKCKFKPAKLHDQSIKVNMNIPFAFKLR